MAPRLTPEVARVLLQEKENSLSGKPSNLVVVNGAIIREDVSLEETIISDDATIDTKTFMDTIYVEMIAPFAKGYAPEKVVGYMFDFTDSEVRVCISRPFYYRGVYSIKNSSLKYKASR